MSYGWLTESSLIPKAGKPIENVSSASLTGLRSLMLEKQEESKSRILKTGTKRTKATQNFMPRMKRKFLESNDGIEERQKKDMKESTESQRSYEYAKLRLAEKAKIYDAVSSGNIDKVISKIALNSKDAQALINIDIQAKQQVSAVDKDTSHDPELVNLRQRLDSYRKRMN